jgi:hypothetical protein
MLRKYVIAFSHVVDDVHVVRTGTDGTVVKDITVPVTYATKSKLFYMLTRRDLDRKYRTVLPRISFVINGMEYDPARKTNSLNEFHVDDDGTREDFQYNGVPYNFNIDMSMWAVYMDDLLQIIEQMATFFRPDYVMTVKEIEELGVERDIPVVLNGVTFDFDNEFEESDRLLRAEANFTLKGFLYPPVSDGRLITYIDVRMRDIDTSKIAETIQIDWDDVTETAETTIKTGQTSFDFSSSAELEFDIADFEALT